MFQICVECLRILTCIRHSSFNYIFKFRNGVRGLRYRVPSSLELVIIA